MHWRETYYQRCVTAQEAISRIKSGDRVVLGHACAEPMYLVDAMVNNYAAYENVEIVQMVPMGRCRYLEPGMEKHFHLNAIFVGNATRAAIDEGRADFTPCSFAHVPRLFDEFLPVDVAMIMVTPPDRYGNCSLGVSVDYAMSAVRNAKLVIAQVNDRMPYTYGNSRIPVEKIDCFVEHSAPLPELQPRYITPEEAKIGEFCASLVEDGDTLQLGIGAIPDAVLDFLKDKKNLGLHSELLSDGVVELIESGVINNYEKSMYPGKSIATFLMGTKRLYDFVDYNPDFELYPVDVVNNPAVIAQNHHMVSINSCVQVDFTGQVNSESLGETQISGSGGQMNFVDGAISSRNGKSIIATTSTTRNGKVSKIVPVLDTGAAVTTIRTNVDYIITEYGIARLTGRSFRQRAVSLINIAHPKFRPELISAYEARFHTPFPKDSAE